MAKHVEGEERGSSHDTIGSGKGMENVVPGKLFPGQNPGTSESSRGKSPGSNTPGTSGSQSSKDAPPPGSK